eukprot:763832-Hanusia_phi.AAC.2
MRDEFQNFIPKPTFVSSLFDGELQPENGPLWRERSGQYTNIFACASLGELDLSESDLQRFRIMSSKAGSFQLNVALVRSEGLLGVYFEDTAMQVPTFTQVDSQILFDSYDVSRNLSSINAVRWMGFIQILVTSTYTFTSNCQGKLLLRVNDRLVLNFVENPSRSSIKLFGNRYYSIDVIFYRSSPSSFCQLLWNDPETFEGQIPPTLLHHHPVSLANSPLPFAITVEASTVCASFSHLRGNFLTLSTVGILSTFLIESKDEFQNVKRGPEDMFVAYFIESNGSSTPIEVDFNVILNQRFASYVRTDSGTHLLEAAFVIGNGLIATYYTGLDFEKPVLVEQLTSVNESFKFLTERFQPTSLRLSGMISLGLSNRIFAALGNENDRIRVWIDNQLLIDQWTSLDSISNISSIPIFDFQVIQSLKGIRIDYNHIDSQAAYFQLNWSYYDVFEQTSGICDPITLSLEECQGIASALGYRSPVVEVESLSNPSGCFLEVQTRNVFLNLKLNDFSCTTALICLCSRNLSRTELDPTYLFRTAILAEDTSYDNIGLFATFYDFPDMTSPIYSILTDGIDFSSSSCVDALCAFDLYPGVPRSIIGPESSLSIRWKGYLQAAYPQVYTFTLSVKEADERVRFWIEDKLLIDQWDSLDSIDTSQTYNFECPTQTVYDIVIEYKDVTGGRGLRMDWETSDIAVIPQQVVPSSRLYILVQRQPLPITVHLAPSTFCSEQSIVQGIGLSLASAGLSSTFTVLAQDEYGNPTSISQDIINTFSVSQVSPHWMVSSENVLVSKGSTKESASSIAVSYRSITKAGPSVLYSSFSMPYGLQATFFDDTNLSPSKAVKSIQSYKYLSLFIQSDANVVPGSAQGTQPPPLSEGGYSLSLTDSYSYSARWTGFLTPSELNEYTFWACMGATTSDRLRVWLDNLIIIDQWTSLDAEFADGSNFAVRILLQKQTTLSFQQLSSHPLRIEYKHYEGPQLLSLMWESQSIQRSYLAAQLFSWNLDLVGQPWQVSVLPATTCASKSFSFGNDVSLSTAGLTNSFTIQSVDAFYNEKTSGGDFYTVRIYSCCGPEITRGNVKDSGSGQYFVNYTAITLAGTHSIYVQLVTGGGLIATYYDNYMMRNPKRSTVDSFIALNSENDFLTPSLSSSQSFSVRWSGYIQLKYASIYTFQSLVGGVDERVKVWMDNSIIIDQWVSISTLTPTATVLSKSSITPFLPIEVKYRQISGNAKFEFRWSYLQNPSRIVPSSDLFQAYTLLGFPAPIRSNSQFPCASTSQAFGLGLTLSRVCSETSFTIIARDAYGNTISEDQAVWLVTLTNAPNFQYQQATSRTTYSSVTWNNFGFYEVSYVGQSSGDWIFISLLDGIQLAATYYASDNLNESTASASILEPNIDFSSGCDECNGVPCHCSLPRNVELDGRNYIQGTPFSVRWTGFLKPDFPSTYEVQLSVGGVMQINYENVNVLVSDERVRLWIDNKLLIDQWDSLDAISFNAPLYLDSVKYFDFKLEYLKKPDPSVLSYGSAWKLRWQNSDVPVFYTIPGGNFYHGNSIQSGPFQYFANLPEVAYSVPWNGPARGGTLLTVVGSNLGDKPAPICPVSVFIGSTLIDAASERVTWYSSSLILALSSPGVGCCNNVTVKLFDHVSKPTIYATFSYDAPSLYGIALSNLPMRGSRITLFGENFGNLDYSTAARAGGSAALITEWISDTALPCTFIAGINQLQMDLIVTLNSQLQTPGLTVSHSFTYDGPSLPKFLLNNIPSTSLIPTILYGAILSPNFDATISSRIGCSASEKSTWLSVSSMASLPAHGIGNNLISSLTVGNTIGSVSNLFSFSSPSVTYNQTRNETGLFALTVNFPPINTSAPLILMGDNYGLEDYTAKSRIGFPQAAGTICVQTLWTSDSMITSKVPTGLSQSLSTAISVSRNYGASTEIVSYDLNVISSVASGQLPVEGSLKFVRILGSCETAGGSYDTLSDAQRICDTLPSLCVGANVCPCLGVIYVSSISQYSLCNKLNYQQTPPYAYPLDMCDNLQEGQVAPSGLKCSEIYVHVPHVESYCVTCGWCRYYTNSVLVLGLNFGNFVSSSRLRIGGTASTYSGWVSDTTLSMKFAAGGGGTKGVGATVVRSSNSFTEVLQYESPNFYGSSNSTNVGRFSTLPFVFLGTGWQLDQSLSARISASSCEFTKWTSATTLSAIRASGVGLSGRMSVTSIVQVGTTTRMMSYDSVSITRLSQSNHATRSSISQNYTASVFHMLLSASMIEFDVTSQQRIHSTSCQLSLWSSESSVGCKRPTGLYRSYKVVSTMAIEVASTSQLFSYDNFLISDISIRNAQLFHSGTKATITGDFGIYDNSVLSNVDQSKMQSTIWLSDSQVSCYIGFGSGKSNSILLTSGSQTATMTDSFSFDFIAMAAPFSGFNIPRSQDDVNLLVYNATNTILSLSMRMSGTSCAKSAWLTATSVSCRSEVVGFSSKNIVLSTHNVVGTLTDLFSVDLSAIQNISAQNFAQEQLISLQYVIFTPETMSVRVGGTVADSTEWDSDISIFCRFHRGFGQTLSILMTSSSSVSSQSEVLTYDGRPFICSKCCFLNTFFGRLRDTVLRQDVHMECR